MKKQTYKERKGRTRAAAIDWQFNFSNTGFSCDDLILWGAHWERLARRFGLLREFRENGII